MHPLDLKLLRDLGTIKGQVIAVALVMACGLTMMIMARSLVRSLEVTQDAYYRTHRFADVFADLKRAPNSLRPRLAEIPGVAAVDTRVRGALTLDLPGLREPADGTILSLPEDRPPTLNLLYLRKGRVPKTGNRNEVVVSEAFANAHGFNPGDSVEATIYGAREKLEIVGVGLSPEFVFESRPGNPLPDAKRFGVFWMNQRPLAIALNLDGAFNDVIVDLAPGAKPAEVMASLDALLAPYGGLIAFDRGEHPSARQVSDRITILRGFAIAFPVLFLSVAAFMTSAALTRLIRLQREQIAQLKAFGYSASAIGSHYLKFAMVIVLLGSLVGSGAGLWLGHTVTILYRRFFFFPELLFHPDWAALLTGSLAAALVCGLGVSGAVWQAMQLPPAEAMRPEPPAAFRASLLERLGLDRLVSPTMRMALRNIERKPWQSLFTLLGLALATAIPIVPGAMRDGIAYIMEFQWTQAQRQDATVSLIEPGSATAWSAMHHLPGVIASEEFRSVSARLLYGQLDRRVAVTGLPRTAQLNLLLDAQGNPVAMPANGLLLSEKLAEILAVKPGDIVRIEVQEGRRPVLETVVAGTITDFSGLGAYMDIDALRRLMREGSTVSGAHLDVDPARWEEFLAAVKASPRIGALSLTSSARESFNSTTGEMMGLVQTIYLSFAVIVAFGVVYNGARIALSERRRDLATLRVIGFQPGEVAGVLVGELVVLTLIAIPVGLYLGGILAAAMVAVASTETVRMPLILSPRSYATAVLVILVSSSLSFLVVSRRIRSLDLLSVLNARD
jgi:putative ABC transport system permease protein